MANLSSRPNRADGHATAGRLAPDSNEDRDNINFLGQARERLRGDVTTLQKQVADLKGRIGTAERRPMKPGPPGAASTVPGPPGDASTVPGPPGPPGGLNGVKGTKAAGKFVAVAENGDDHVYVAAPSGGGTGGGGGGSVGTVKSYATDSTVIVTVDFGGGSKDETCINRSGTTPLGEGDKVAVVQQTKDGEPPMIVARHTTSNPYQPKLLGPFQTSAGYPIEQSKLGLSYAIASAPIRDAGNILGRGSDCLMDASAFNSISVYDPSTGYNGKIQMADGFTSAVNSGYGWNGGPFVASGKLWAPVQNPNTGQLQIHRYDAAADAFKPTTPAPAGAWSVAFAAAAAGNAGRPTYLSAEHSGYSSDLRVSCHRLAADGTSWDTTQIATGQTWASAYFRPYSTYLLAAAHGFAWFASGDYNASALFAVDFRGATPQIVCVMNNPGIYLGGGGQTPVQGSAVSADGGLVYAGDPAQLLLVKADGTIQRNKVLPDQGAKYSPRPTQYGSASAIRPIATAAGIFLCYLGRTTDDGQSWTDSAYVAKTDGITSEIVWHGDGDGGAGINPPAVDPDGTALLFVGGNGAAAQNVNRITP